MSTAVAKLAFRAMQHFDSALWLAPRILVVEAILLAFAPPIAIFGFNPLREFLAEYVFWWAGNTKWHLAGALTDFKKMLLYACFFLQLVHFKALLLCHEESVSKILGTRFVQIRPMRALAPFPAIASKWKARAAVGLASVLATAAMIFVLYVVACLWLAPSLTDHVFGPVGKGLFSSWLRADISQPGHIYLVCYRLWYITAALYAGLVAGASVYFSVLRSVEILESAAPDDGDIDGSLKITGWLLVFSGAPLATIAALWTLIAVNDSLGVGEVSGKSLEVVSAAAGFLGSWVVATVAFYLIMVKPTKSQCPAVFSRVASFAARTMMLIVLILSLFATYASFRPFGALATPARRELAAGCAARDVVVFHLYNRLDLADPLWAQMQRIASAGVSDPACIPSAIVGALVDTVPERPVQSVLATKFDRASLVSWRGQVLRDFREKVEKLGVATNRGAKFSAIADALRHNVDVLDAGSIPACAPTASEFWGTLLLAVGFATGLRHQLLVGSLPKSVSEYS